MTTTISILGCGWLGWPLARSLIRSGNVVKGATTQREKMDPLKADGVIPFHFSVVPGERPAGAEEFWRSRVLVLALPFRRDFEDPAYYQRQIETVIRCLSGTVVEHVIFTGSTSVYPQTTAAAREDVAVIPDTPRAAVLLEAERALLEQRGFATTVLRLAGLYGPGRPIGKFLAGRRGVSGGSRPVNLVHLDDVVRVVIQIIREKTRGEVFNVCSDGHPTRRELYTRAAGRRGMPPPEFLPDEHDGGKIVCNAKLKKYLRYRFVHPDPMDDTA